MREKQKILIVDDKAENLFSLRQVLADTETQIIEADNGNDALIASLNHEFALAILDVQMPDMDGYELAEFLRSEEQTRQVPIIFVSAVFSSEYHVFKGYESGAVDFMVKPFDARILLSKVNIFLELDRHRNALAQSKERIRKQLQELKASENRFESLVATVPDIVYRINPQGDFTFLNDAVKRLGYDPKELVGQHFSTLILPVDLDRVSRETAVKALQASPAPDSPKLFDERRTGVRKITGLEIRLIPKKGFRGIEGILERIGEEAVVVEINSAGYYSRAVTQKNKVFLGSVGVVRDITQRKQMENDLRRSNQELERRVAQRTRELTHKNEALTEEIDLRKAAEQTILKAKKEWEEIFEAIGHMAMVVDADHTILAANRTVEEQTGLSKEMLVGRKCHDVFHGEKTPDSQCPMGIHMASGEHKAVEMELNALDKTFICSSTPVLSPDGHLEKIINIWTDITRRKTLEKELIQAHKMEAIGTLAGGIAHDFNNILSALMGFSQLALRNAERGSVMEEDLSEILNCGERAKELVRQILTFARQSDEEYAYIHLDYIVKEVSKFIRSTIPANIELSTEVESSATVFANATQIHQVLMNLCTNAAHAMTPDGGTLGIRLEEVQKDRGMAGTEKKPGPKDYLSLEVSDTGSGISPKVIDKIFEPYFTTKEQGEGTGMGLAVVQGIVKDIGGTIQVKTDPGNGTVFTVLLPIARGKAAVGNPTPKESPGKGNEHILLVDDESTITKVGKRMLENSGYRVTTTNDATQALDLFQKAPEIFDLVVTDLTMPKMKGDQLIHRILDFRPDTPVIICTGYQKKELIDDLLMNRLDAFVSKPFNEEVFIRIIRKVLDRAKAHKTKKAPKI